MGRKTRVPAPFIPHMDTLSPRTPLTGVGIRRSSRSLAVDGDRESGRRLRPGLGGEPEATPEPAPREQAAQPLEAQPDQADPAGAGAGPGRGRGAQAGRRQAALARVLDPGAVRPPPRPAPRHPQPVPRAPRGIGPARALPLPAQALEGPEAELDPRPQRV